MICPEELVALISAMSVVISKGLTNEQINILAAALVLLGDNLAVISVQRERLESCFNSNENNEQIELI